MTEPQSPSQPAPVAAAPPARRSWGRRLTLWALASLVGVIAVFVLYVWLALRFAYSDGERAGYVQKFSRKGWVCKTWEGELVMATMPGMVPEVFRFTVRDDAVAAKLNQHLGERVSLHYEQHLGLPSSCFGETQYFVTDLRRVQQ